MQRCEALHQLKGHTDALSFCAWSPDDSLLLTCGNDYKVKLWDTKTGELKRTFDKHKDSVTACAWFPCGTQFVSGGLDKLIYRWNIDEDMPIHQWSGTRVNDLAVSHDGSQMVAICSEKKIRLYQVDDSRSTEKLFAESEAITSLCLSEDSRFLLVNIASQEIHLWDLKEESIVQKYTGHKQGRFVIRSSFGGTNQAFIISGSEDSQVYIWHRRNGTLLEALPGHSGTVNSVSWSPNNPHMFASASDDHTIRVWCLTDATEPESVTSE
jgi:WD40 repeat protein